MEVMISDLPHIMYHPPKYGTQAEQENRVIVMRDMREKIQKGGLGAVGVNLSFSNKKAINGNELLEQLKSKK